MLVRKPDWLGRTGRMTLQLEVWTSTHQRKERHYFVKDGKQHGYQIENAYLCGVNPELVTPEQERAILAILGYALD